LTCPDDPGHKPLVVNVVLVGPLEEEEEGTGVASEVVKVEGEDPVTPGYYLRSVDTRKARDRNDSPIFGLIKQSNTHTFFFLKSPIIGPDSYRKGSMLTRLLAAVKVAPATTENFPDPCPPTGAPVQLPWPSVGQYVLGSHLNHDARWRKH